MTNDPARSPQGEAVTQDAREKCPTCGNYCVPRGSRSVNETATEWEIAKARKQLRLAETALAAMPSGDPTRPPSPEMCAAYTAVFDAQNRLRACEDYLRTSPPATDRLQRKGDE